MGSIATSLKETSKAVGVPGLTTAVFDHHIQGLMGHYTFTNGSASLSHPYALPISLTHPTLPGGQLVFNPVNTKHLATLKERMALPLQDLTTGLKKIYTDSKDFLDQRLACSMQITT